MPQPDHITALDTPDAAALEAGLPEDLQKYFAICRDKLGMVPNVLTAYAFRPEKLRWFSRFYNEMMLGESGLSELEREMVATVVSAANRCYYCIVAHGQAVRALSGDPQLGDLLATNYRLAPLDTRQRALLDFAHKLTVASAEIEEADRAKLREVGLSEADIFDLADVAALFNATNRMASALAMMPNPAYHSMDRQAPDGG